MQPRLPGVLSVVVVALCVCLTIGCGGGVRGVNGQQKQGFEPPPPKQAPAPPPKKDVPLDPALKNAARVKVSESLRSSDPLVRAQALEALRNSPDMQTPGQVVAALRDPQAVVRFAAGMTAGELKLKEAYSALRDLAADDPNGSVQVAARFALHKLGDTALSHDFEKLAKHNDPRVRRNVALALGLLGEKSALTTILPVLKLDIDPLVRQQAYEAMWRLGEESALTPLVALTASAYADDKIIGLLALAAPKRTIVREHVRGLLAGDDVHVEVALVAARAMGMLASDEGYRIALNGAAAADPNQRFLAALALGAIGRNDAQEPLRKLLSAPEPNVQLAAASAILQLNSQGSGAGSQGSGAKTSS
jgi:HEAT repeat protein